MKKLGDNGGDKNGVEGGVIWDSECGSYIEGGGLGEGERIGGGWGYIYEGVYDRDEEGGEGGEDRKV